MMEARAQWHGFVVRNKSAFRGGFHPPHPPSAERRAAIFWRAPQLTAPIFSTTDERYGFVKIPREARVWGILSF